MIRKSMTRSARVLNELLTLDLIWRSATAEFKTGVWSSNTFISLICKLVRLCLTFSQAFQLFRQCLNNWLEKVNTEFVRQCLINMKYLILRFYNIQVSSITWKDWKNCHVIQVFQIIRHSSFLSFMNFFLFHPWDQESHRFPENILRCKHQW